MDKVQLRRQRLYTYAQRALLVDATKDRTERASRSMDEMLRAFVPKKHGGEVMTCDLAGKENINEIIQSVKESRTATTTQRGIDAMRKRGRR